MLTLQEESKTHRFNLLIGESLEKKLTTASQQRGITKAAYVRLALESALEREEELELERAVRELAPLYETDQDLTALTALDGEDFS